MENDDDFFYGRKNWLVLPDALLRELPLPPDWTFRQESARTWATFFGPRDIATCLERMEGKDGVVVSVYLGGVHTQFKEPEEAYRFVWQHIMLGVL